MLVFPNAKINLGLHVVNKREDGFHNLETVFYPIPLSDSLEMVHDSTLESIHLESFGIAVDGNPENNLIIKAYQLLKKDFPLKGIRSALLKNIPTGAGLGGGSSDGTFALKLLNELYELQLSNQTLEKYALQLGSDCPFFVSNKAVYAEGRGELFSPIHVSLQGYWFVLIKPDVHVSTAMAFSHVKKRGIENAGELRRIIESGVVNWKEELQNDFESSVFIHAPEVKKIKDLLYEGGAVYASMSGSGSSVFGIFTEPFSFKEKMKHCFVFESWL